MPDEALDQGQTIDDLILDILDYEAHVVLCLQVFFCLTLQEIQSDPSLSTEKKVQLTTDLINAAAKKEEALASVLEAISLFEANQCPPGWLRPGDRYDIDVVPDRFIISITVRWEDGGAGAFGTLHIDDIPYLTAPVSDLPGDYTWTGLDYLATESTRAWIEITGGCANIISVEVDYQPLGTPVAPGGSITIPAFPPEIRQITLDARTAQGTTSTLELFVSGVPIQSQSVNASFETIIFDLPSLTPVDTLSLTNTGDATIYYKNLITFE